MQTHFDSDNPSSDSFPSTTKRPRPMPDAPADAPPDVRTNDSPEILISMHPILHSLGILPWLC